MTNKQTIDLLNGLLTKAYDAEQGYQTAAEHAQGDLSLQSFFQHQSGIRRQMGHDLKEEILRLGGEPDKGASVVAKAHQVWIAMRGFVTGGDNDAILEECIRGEQAALDEYDEAIRMQGLDPQVSTFLSAQRGRIAEALSAVETGQPVAS